MKQRGGLGFKPKMQPRPAKAPGPLLKRGAPGGQTPGVTPLPGVRQAPPQVGGVDPLPMAGGGMNYAGGSQTFNETTGMGGAASKVPMANEQVYGLPVQPPEGNPFAQKKLLG